MAGLLLCVMLSIPLLGCLIPQDEQVIPELPPKRNSPLKIVSQEPQDPRTSYFNSTTCAGNPVFKLTVEDEDVADVVSSLWFIDKANDGSSLPIPTSPVQGGVSRARTVAAPNALGFRLANLAAKTTHVLTVYVADSAFQEVVAGQVTVSRPDRLLPDNTLVPDKGSIDSFTWVLDVEACQ
jgi:hypothetical protein